MLIGRVSANVVVTCGAGRVGRGDWARSDHDRPVGGRGEREADAGLEVGLIEAGEELVGVGRDEQGVEVVAPVGRVVVADDARPARRDVGDEVEVERVLAGSKQTGRDEEVSVADAPVEIGGVSLT